MYSNWNLAVHFANGGTSGKSARAFIIGNKLYSFGTHFIVAERDTGVMARVTTRRVSATTAKHTTLTLRALENKGYIVQRMEL